MQTVSMTREEMKALIERLHLIWNTADLTAIPDVYSPDFIVHWSRTADPPESHGHEGIRCAIQDTRAAFPDWQERVVDLVIEGNRIVTRYVSTGTHQGSFLELEPTGRRIEIDEISIFRVENGKVAEQWCLVDDLTLMRQLGRHI